MFTANHTAWKERIQASVMSPHCLHTQSFKRSHLSNTGTEASKLELLKHIVLIISQLQF